MSTSVRLATAGDIDALSTLTAAGRRRLAEWSPTWWRRSPSAEELHPLWLAHLIQSDGPVVRVVEDDSGIIGCCASMPQPGQWFIDDLAVVTDNRWPDAGAQLLEAVVERPALTCVPVADRARAAALRAAGLRHVSSYWIGPTEARSPIGANPATAAATATTPPQPISPATDLPEPPPHTFGGRLDPGTDGALAFTQPGVGLVVGSPSTPAPPVFDPGGTVCVIDRIIGADRAGLLNWRSTEPPIGATCCSPWWQPWTISTCSPNCATRASSRPSTSSGGPETRAQVRPSRRRDGHRVAVTRCRHGREFAGDGHHG